MISHIRCRINDLPYLDKFIDFVLQSVLGFLLSIENESPFSFIFQLKIERSSYTSMPCFKNVKINT